MKDIIDESKKIAGLEQMNLYLTDEEMIENDRKYFIEVGRKEYMHEMIINMYKDNLDINMIAKYANISVKEVEKIIKQGK